MMYEEIIDCPKSGGDLCYKTQPSPNVTNYMSLSCGFWTNTLMKPGEEFYEQQISTLPELYIDLAWEDPKTGLVWIPNTINEPGKGMVFANGTDKSDWSWAAVKSIEIPEEERHNHPLPGKKDEFMKYKMDMDNMKHFSEGEYIDALDTIGLFQDS